MKKPKYTQSSFDNELKTMLDEAKRAGKTRLKVVSKELHDRVVRPSYNYMPMACNAMWKIWDEQGSRQRDIRRTTKSGQSSTIEIEFDTT